MKRRGETKDGLSGRVYDEQMKEEAEKAFAEHQISRRSDDRWMLQRMHADGKWDWTMAAEVVDLAGRLYVGGDIYPVIFGHSSDSPRGKVAWLGGTKDVSYVHQKAPVVDVGTGRMLTVVDVSERYDFGVVCDPRVYYAWGALRRLHLLLCEEEEKERGEEAEPEAGGSQQSAGGGGVGSAAGA